MGQQQLILLVLATVIVGLAIVVGIAAFTQGGDRANADAMIQDAVTIASDIQSTMKKPQPFGGVEDFNDITLGALGYPVDPDIADHYTNGNGQFSLTSSDGGVIIEGRSTSNPNYNGTDALEDPNTSGDPAVGEAEQVITVAVCGLTENDITGATMFIGGTSTGATAPDCS